MEGVPSDLAVLGVFGEWLSDADALWGCNVIALFLAMMPPALSIPPETAYPLPEYRADCRLVDRDGKRVNARVDVSGVGETRKLQVALKSRKFPELRKKTIYSGSSIRTSQKDRWTSVLDAEEVKPGKERQTIWIEVGADLSQGAELKLTQEREVVPLMIGLCSTEPLAKKAKK